MRLGGRKAVLVRAIAKLRELQLLANK